MHYIPYDEIIANACKECRCHQILDDAEKECAARNKDSATASDNADDADDAENEEAPNVSDDVGCKDATNPLDDARNAANMMIVT